MITYRITSKITPSANSSANKEDQVKTKILLKALQKAQKVFPLGCTVKFKGTNREATVLGYRSTITESVWKGQKPFFIQIKFHDDLKPDVVLVHSSSLTRVVR